MIGSLSDIYYGRTSHHWAWDVEEETFGEEKTEEWQQQEVTSTMTSEEASHIFGLSM